MLTKPDSDLARRAGEGAPGHNVIGGALAAARSGAVLEVASPSDGIGFAKIARSDAADVDAAVAAARAAFEAGPWAKMAAAERGRLLTRLGDRIADHAGELAALESRDTGKPLRQGIADVTATLRYFEYYGGAADKVHGEQIPFLDGYTALTLREPHGVVAGIIPWNYPLQILARVAGAALAMGNTLVIKPAEDASLTAIRVAELALEAGFPDGVFNVVTGLGSEAGAALSAHADVDYVTFTGSPATGTAIQTAAAENNRGVTMELGGKSPQIVFADADIEAALPVLVNAIIQNGGQTCSAGSRILIERPVYDTVASELAARFAALTAEPHWADGDLGPLINAKQAERVARFVANAKAAGTDVLAEGSIAADAPKGGHYQAPVLFGAVEPDSALAREEVFGPVLSLFVFDGEEEAVRLANGTDYGLVAGVWTKDGGRQHRMAKRVRAGQVFVNGYGAGGGIELPFGGFKRSGHGREKGFEALRDMSATKTVIFNHG
ncbi:MAG: aldehyde dehydrogenase family protein [Roseitalea sp.]|jgi:aldehyde dehydrogenase (NAD+)|nr:aldehyde dehydrogenase family protein [Roseitalea sp.]MBO6952753.1 aldehyde dehydrogenase family protein [Rhizobiaceae bacterium]MBO6592760.1 aldehyde dehydrogenase family protein [Roseitalea sp.]MBO6600497.1 aldehyde dehydrogenase family protein [Roseitalea sp.]MBO6612961.1 aldehyde dehydrogenase family protein [Roseitalea sp.]